MRWKWIAIGAAGLAAAVLIAGYAILASYDYNQLKPSIIREVKTATGRDLTLQGDIKLAVSFSPSLSVEGVALSNAPWGSRGQMITVKRVEVQVELIPLLSGEIRLDKLVLLEPDILMEIDRDGRSNLDFTPPGAKAGQAGQARAGAGDDRKSAAASASGSGPGLPPLAFSHLRLEKGLLTYHDQQSGAKHQLDLQTLQGSAPGLQSPVKLEIKGAMDGEGFGLAGEVGSLAGLQDTAKPWPVDLKGSFREADIIIKGGLLRPLLGEGLDLNVQAQGRDLARLLPGSGLAGPFQARFHLRDPQPKVYKLSELKLSAQGGDLAGWLRADISGPRPKLAAQLAAGLLDFTRFTGEVGAAKPAAAPAGKAPAQPGQADQAQAQASAPGPRENKQSQPVTGSRRDKVFSAEPLPLAALSEFDADLNLTAGKIALPSLVLEEVGLQARLEQGALQVKPLSAKLHGGALQASLSLKPLGKAARADLELSLAGCQVGELLAGMGQGKYLEGPLEIKASLGGAGQSLAAIMAGLSGRLSLIIQQGRINNKYVEAAGGDLTPVLGKILLPTAGSQAVTKLNCLVMGFNVVDGQAKSNVILMNTENMVVLGEGRLNLASEELDLKMHPEPKGNLSQKATGGLAGINLGQLAKPFKLTGTLARPRVGIDQAGAISALARTLGGYAVMGPLGAAAGALTSAGAGEQAGCAEAVAAAQAGHKFEPKSAPDQARQEGQAGDQKESGEERFKKDIEEGVEKLKSLFGN